MLSPEVTFIGATQRRTALELPNIGSAFTAQSSSSMRVLPDPGQSAIPFFSWRFRKVPASQTSVIIRTPNRKAKIYYLCKYSTLHWSFCDMYAIICKYFNSQSASIFLAPKGTTDD
ncbi:hypothetical protein I7I53_09591 [Histoplasma capsulatum var. duboisii H88]|uniref:Uncharacterized protein n=1 Tax=Ajellomyces capsulatus (strain H88) TaxID=544711 RepID=A0A8A1L905_AJEC8|nr:hypothetical protein I7I53_09591 [Histoplasma capsulatum var. duboisii H88]